MARMIVCPKCNGTGFKSNGAYASYCEDCSGTGELEIFIENIAVGDEVICITKKEYDELLEYKYMYEKLCE